MGVCTIAHLKLGFVGHLDAACRGEPRDGELAFSLAKRALARGVLVTPLGRALAALCVAAAAGGRV